MRRVLGAAAAALLCTAPWFSAAAQPPGSVPAQPPGSVLAPPPGRAPVNANRRARPPLISSRHIDRFDAIDSLQKTLQQNPRSLADWVILGELAHEVAIDSPASEAAKYFRMSRGAYEKALALAPNNPGLKAAVQFAKDQEAGQNQFETQRDRATQTYLDARRRDLAATGYAPMVRIDAPSFSATTVPTADTTAKVANVPVPADIAPPATPPAATAPPDQQGVVTNRHVGVQQFYGPYPTYQPYWTNTTAAPYTYQQYSSAYYPPNVNANTAIEPMTVQRWTLQAPAAVGPPARQVPIP